MRPAGEHVDLAGLEGDGAGRGVGDELEVDLVEVGPVLDVVVLVADEVDEGPFAPLLELHRPGADRRVVRRVRAVVGALVDVLRDHRGRGDLVREEKGPEGLLQGEADRAVVHLLDLLHLRVDDRPPARVNLAQELVHGEDDVVGRERLAVVELHPLLQPERVGLLVRRDLPALGERGLGLELVVVAQQRFVDVARDHVGRAVLVEALHQHRRLGGDHHLQGAALLRGSCRRRARRGRPLRVGGAGEKRERRPGQDRTKLR